MKKIIICISILCISCTAFTQSPAASLDTLLSVYARQYKFNGAALVAKNGKIILNKGYGSRDAAAGVPHDETSIFQIGSVTKQFTTAILLKLQEQNKLGLQDKLSKYFPDYPSGDSITIEQLMTHTSGIYSYTNDRQFMQTQVTVPQTREKMLALFKDKPMDFKPGKSWQYSNSAYMLLGYIIEDVTKKTYEKVVREYIFSPLKMSQSGFDFTHLEQPEKAVGYFILNDVDTVKSPIVDSSVSYAAGAIYSTTTDLYKWHQGLQQYKVLSKAQQEKAYTPLKNKYGYGWIIDSVYGKRVVAHGGGIHGFSSNFARIPEDDVCVILLSNTAAPALQAITKSIFAILYNQPYTIPQELVAVKLPVEKLNEYRGEYEIRPDLHVEIFVKDGQLMAQPTKQSLTVLYAEKEDHFFAKTPELKLRFKRNETREITGFTLYQGASVVECKKVK